ncbi:MAG: phosphoribosylaminoimidazolesuccinocarboxamide synthase [Chitinophagales bacterium]|nr:phosphoribosylaminoimidazolesuccinocarboxamide synthase [Chitinophagales bacterium]MDW8274222.1 phosphoribosylaminoimidazolesuccinocarboxamide synthase [Chitinophagales bacterium]
MQTIEQSNFNLPGQKGFYRGKVRDVYYFEDTLVVVATDRISAFDHILPRAIPYKGQVLNLLSAHFLNATRDICPNWLLDTPHPNVSIGLKCEPIRIEMVVRGYLAGHAARIYATGNRLLCGVILPEGLRENDKLPYPIITPSTKAIQGHDEDISKEEILKRKIVDEDTYTLMENYALRLFERGSEMALRQGLLLVDTKYEFGLYQNKLYVIDEIHTPDSSRYFYADGYEEKQSKGLPQQQLSKEFVRQWLIQNNFQGKEGQIIPAMPDDIVEEISNRYINLYNLLTGKEFLKQQSNNLIQEIEQAILKALDKR